ncbi:MAG: cytochrome c oxidase subunit 4 [Nocardioidaceae bacterium]
MRAEAYMVVGVAVFFLVTTPVYWFMSYDPTGTAALIMTFLLLTLLGFYLVVVARQIPERPEDNNHGEIVEGAGEVGFFSPYSWWPFFAGLALTTVVLGIIIGWWLFIIGAGLMALTVCGWVFEYYRGVHAH